MADETIRVIARIVVKPDKLDEVRTLLMSLIGPTCNEPRCIRYELTQNRKNPAEFAFIEEWANDAALNAHFATEHVKAAFAKVPALLAEPPDIRQYKGLA